MLRRRKPPPPKRNDAPSGISAGNWRVIPGWSEGPDPESRDSGFDASHRSGMTEYRSNLAEQLVDIVPVDEVIDERLQIVGTAVAIVDVVGMLPDVAAEDRRGAMDQRISAVRGLRDVELAVLQRQPAPAGAELPDAGGGEIGLEFFQPAEIRGDLVGELGRQLITAA